MRIKNCRICKSKKLEKLFSLGNMCFTGKFPNERQIIKKQPILLLKCKNCELVQLGHSFNLKYLYGPDYGYRTGINKTMLNHVNKVVKNLSVKTKLKKNDFVLDIASNDGSLLKYYDKKINTFGIDPILNKYKKEYKKINLKDEEPTIKSLDEILKFFKKYKLISNVNAYRIRFDDMVQES